VLSIVSVTGLVVFSNALCLQIHKDTRLLSTHLETDTTVVVSSFDDDNNKHYSKEEKIRYHL
jgi:hypothetical protein